MLFTTPTEWAALGFTLIAGWLFGLASSSGGKKWKRQLEEAELNYASARDRDEAELWNAQIRIRDLERELRDSRPAPSAAPVAATAAAAAAAPTLIERVQEAAEAKPEETKAEPEPPVPEPVPEEPAEESEPEEETVYIKRKPRKKTKRTYVIEPSSSDESSEDERPRRGYQRRVPQPRFSQETEPFTLTFK